MTAPNAGGLPDFANPPLIEVVCGVLFRQMDALLVPHFGQLWLEKFKADYPLIREADPLLPMVERFGEAELQEPSKFVEFGALPRVWFVEERENAIVQIQRDRFLHNWKKVSKEDEYPRFGRVSELFYNRLARFTNFLEEQGLGKIDPRQYELTYINHIPAGQGWERLADVGKVFPDFSWRVDENRALQSPSAINWVTVINLPENVGRLRSTLVLAVNRATKQPIFSLDMTVRGMAKDKSPEAMRHWFEQAHEWIVRGFVDMTSDEIRHKFWGQKA